ncbi:hypothetical protein C4D60_Mb03t00280 [Musa balbisiana]|uniref:Uncharacterized protein n=1 Tax=Musa balbisiana TaxID=52838 RepID=A0A4S8J8X8_MUSBA|nr:hypothetical protein C4D60_Mb03t00280 [Musa balbisiana]
MDVMGMNSSSLSATISLAAGCALLSHCTLIIASRPSSFTSTSTSPSPSPSPLVPVSDVVHSFAFAILRALSSERSLRLSDSMVPTLVRSSLM